MKTLFKGFKKYSRWMRLRKRILQVKAVHEAFRVARLRYYQEWNMPQDDYSTFKIKGVAK